MGARTVKLTTHKPTRRVGRLTRPYILPVTGQLWRSICPEVVHGFGRNISHIRVKYPQMPDIGDWTLGYKN
jgi:hypothetical protein